MQKRLATYVQRKTDRHKITISDFRRFLVNPLRANSGELTILVSGISSVYLPANFPHLSTTLSSFEYHLVLI
jgi:hypothetical protein